MATTAFSFTPLPALTAAEKDARVWAWICAQHSICDTDSLVALDVEDECARIRSSFSDASGSESEVLFVDPDYDADQLVAEPMPEPDADALDFDFEAMMTLDDLVVEIDQWLAARRPGVDIPRVRWSCPLSPY